QAQLPSGTAGRSIHPSNTIAFTTRADAARGSGLRRQRGVDRPRAPTGSTTRHRQAGSRVRHPRVKAARSAGRTGPDVPTDAGAFRIPTCPHDRPSLPVPTSGLSASLMRLSQAYAGPTAVFINEFNARGLECAANGQIICRRQRSLAVSYFGTKNGVSP